MASSDKASAVRSLSPSEVIILVASLELRIKSLERAARAASNSVIASEFSKEADISRNLMTHFRNGSLDV